MPTAELEASSPPESTADIGPPQLEAAPTVRERAVAPRVEPADAARGVAIQPRPKPTAIAREPAAATTPETEAVAHEPAATPAADTPASIAPTPRPPREVTTGTLLGGRYLLGRLLGSGGSSLLFQAEDRRRIGAQDFGNRIAIKVLRPEARSNTHAVTRLRREFRQMQRLSHPGIAKVYELGRDEDIWFMTMELIEGQTINQWLKTSAHRGDGLKLIGACCEALHHAHSVGVVHGDLKPSNVLVLANATVKLVDFGSAAERDASMGVIDTERSYAATPQYASPQVLAGEAADPRDDVFSLACLAYAVLTHGEHPFERKASIEARQAQLRPAYSPAILPRQFEVIARALAWDREQRPATVREFMHALLASDLRREPARDGTVSEAASHAPKTAPPPPTNPIPTTPGDVKPTGGARPASDVKPEDVARLKAAVAAAETKNRDTTPPPKEPLEKSKPDPLERFKGYVVGPLASRREDVGATPTPTVDERHSPPKKRKWTWPWQRSSLFGILLIAAAAIIASRVELETEPITATTSEAAAATEDRSAADATRIASTAAPSVAAEAPSQPIVEPVEEKKSPPVAMKPKATPARGEVSFTTRTLQIAPNQTVAALSVKRSSSTRGRARVAWTIEGGTARPGVHYEVETPQIIEFLDGQSVRSLFIPLKPDKDAEGMRRSKTFTVKLQQTNGGPALGEIKQVHVTIAGAVTDAELAATTAETRD